MHFLVILLFVLTPDVAPPLPEKPCAIKVEYSSTKTGNDEDIRITIKVSGGAEPYYYFFFDEKNNPMSWDFKQNYYDGEKTRLPKKIKVIDADGCFEWVELNESAISNG